MVTDQLAKMEARLQEAQSAGEEGTKGADEVKARKKAPKVADAQKAAQQKTATFAPKVTRKAAGQAKQLKMAEEKKLNAQLEAEKLEIEEMERREAEELEIEEMEDAPKTVPDHVPEKEAADGKPLHMDIKKDLKVRTRVKLSYGSKKNVKGTVLADRGGGWFAVVCDSGETWHVQLYGTKALKHVELLDDDDEPLMVRFKTSLSAMVFNEQNSLIADPTTVAPGCAFTVVNGLDVFSEQCSTGQEKRWVENLGTHEKIFTPGAGGQNPLPGDLTAVMAYDAESKTLVHVSSSVHIACAASFDMVTRVLLDDSMKSIRCAILTEPPLSPPL